MATVDELIDGLVGAGRVDGEGRFTLDRAQARAKMQAFQLPDPMQYLLHWVEAAVAQGATGVAFEFDSDDVRVTFDGPPFGLADFEHLYGALFSKGGLASRRHLALGLNAALGLEPRFIVVTSGDVRLELRPGTPDDYGVATEPRDDTQIHLRERFPGFRQLARLIEVMRGGLAEAALIRARCQYSRVPIYVDGAQINRGFLLPPTYVKCTLEAPDAVIGIGLDEVRPDARLVSHGVLVRTHTLPALSDTPDGFPPGFVAFVDASALPRDVAQTDFIRGPAYAAMLSGLHAGSRALLARFIRSAHGDPPDENEGVARARALAVRLIDAVEGPGLRARYGEAVAEALVSVPRWRCVSGRWLSLATLRAAAPTPFTSDPDLVGAPLADGLPFVLLAEPDLVERLPALLGHALADVTTRLVEHRTRERRRQRWRQRAASPHLTRTHHLVVAPIRSAHSRGEVGVLREPPGDDSLVEIIVQGGLLTQRKVTLPLSGLEIVIEAPLVPNAEFDDVERDSAFAECVDAIVSALPGLINQLAELTPGTAVGRLRQRALVRQFLSASTGHGGLRRAMLEAFDAARAAPFPPPEPGAEDLSGLNLREALGLVRGRAPAALARVPLFSTAEDTHATLAEIATWLDVDQKICWVPDHLPACPGLARPVLRLTADQRALLRRLLRTSALVDYRRRYDAQLAERRFMAQPQSAPQVAVTGLRARFEFHDIQGEIAMVAVGRRDDRSVPTALYKLGRPLFDIALPFPVRQLEAAVGCDRLLPGRDWTGDPIDPALVDVRVALGYGVRALLRALQHIAPSPAQHRLLIDVLNLVFPSYPMRRAYDLLMGRRDADEAESAYRSLLALHAEHGTQRMDRALERLLSNTTTPLPGVVAKSLKADPPKLDSLALTFAIIGGDPFARNSQTPLHQRILAACPALADLRALVGLDAAASLGDIAEQLVLGPVLTLRSERARPPGSTGLVLVVDLHLRAALTRFFGSGTMKDALRFWRKARLAEALAERPPLPEGEVENELGARSVRVGGQRARVSLRHPYGDGRWRLRLARKGRLIAELTHREGSPLDAVINGPSLPVVLPDVGPIHIEPDFIPRVHTACREARPRLLALAAEKWSELSTEARESARLHFIDHFIGDDVPIEDVMGCRCFRSIAGSMLALEDLAALSATGTLHFVNAGADVGLVDGEAIGVWVTPTERERLRRRLGAVPDYSEVWDAARAKTAFFARPPEAVKLSESVECRVPVTFGQVSGEVGFCPDSATPLQAEVFKHRRSMGRLEVPVAVHGLRAALDHDGLVPLPDWTGVYPDDTLLDLAGAARSGLRDLVAALGRAGPAPNPTVARFALDVALQAVPSEALRDAFAAFAAADVATAGARYRELLALAFAVDVVEISMAVSLMLAERQLPTAPEVVALAGPFERNAQREAAAMAAVTGCFQGTARTLLGHLLQDLPGLAALPLVDGAPPVTLGRVLAAIEGTGYLLVGSDPVEADALVLPTELAAPLRALLGDDRVRTTDAWVEEQALRAQLAERPVMPAELSPDEVVVRMTVDEDGYRGELGLEQPFPAWGGRALSLCLDGRFVQQVRSRAQLPIVGILTGDDLGLTSDEGVLRLGRLDGLKALCRKAQVPLLRQLVGAWPSLGAEARAAGWDHALRWLLAVAEGRVEDPGPERLLTALAGLAGFRGVDGRRHSLDDLRRSAGKFGAVHYIRGDGAGAPLHADHVVLVIEDDDELRALEKLCEVVEDYTVGWRAEQRMRRSNERLPGPPVDALHVVEVELEGGSASVWLGPPTGVVYLGCDGALLESCAATDVLDLPASAAIEQDVIGVEDGFGTVDLEGLRQAVGQAYAALAHAYAFGAFEDPATAQRAGARLTEAMRRLFANRDQLGADRVELLDTLAALPLLHDAKGRVRHLAEVEITPIPGLEAWFAGDAAPEEPDPPPLVLAEAVRRLLRILRPEGALALADEELARIEVDEVPNELAVLCEAKRTVINARHPAVQLALDAPDDEVTVAFLASAVFSALNHAQDTLTDAHERQFLEALTDAALGGAPESESARG